MGKLRITISLPEELAIQFVRAVPSNRRSRFVAGLIQAELSGREAEREEMFRRACLTANDDPETRQIEDEFDALFDTMLDAWEQSPPR
jgi:metal-responsive CopG/Arc/MetJ family transcriptional regulator